MCQNVEEVNRVLEEQYQSLIEVNASDTKIVNTVFRLYQSLIEVNASLSFLAARGGLNCINPL